MKKVLLLIVMMVAMMAVPVYAEEAIGLNEEKTASNGWDEYLFTPEEAGLYALVISEGGEVEGQVVEYNSVSESFDGIAIDEGVEKLTLVFEAEQGHEYSLYVSNNESKYGRDSICKVKVVKYEKKTISFTPAKPYEYVKGCGYWDGNVFTQGFKFHNGDVLTVDGVEYTYNKNAFVKGNDKITNVKFEETEDNVTIEYQTSTCQIPVNTVDSLYTGMRFTTTTSYTYEENDTAKGEWRTKNGEKYFHYFVYKFKAGDKLTLINGDTEEEFTYVKDGEKFVSASGKQISGDFVKKDSRQSTKHWTLGTENTMYFTFAGVEASIPVTITPAHTHVPVKVEQVEPTCTEYGIKSYWKCSVCNKTFKDEACTEEFYPEEDAEYIIPEKGHSLKKLEAKKATATKTGNVECYVCETCGKHFSDEKGRYELKNWKIKCKNPMTVKAKKLTVKAPKTVKVLTVKSSKGKVTYKKTSGNSKITVNKTTGKLTVKKGIKKGSYKVKVKVSDAGNATYLSKAKTVTVTVKVK